MRNGDHNWPSLRPEPMVPDEDNGPAFVTERVRPCDNWDGENPNEVSVA